MNKKASIEGTIWIVGGLFLLMFFALIFVFGAMTTNWVADTVTPEFRNLGMISGLNATSTTDIVASPVNSFINGLTWMGGVLYILGLIAIFGLAFAFRSTNQRWIMPLFFGLMILLVIASIFISNIYQDFYTGTDDVATALQSYSVLSTLILYSPAILTICGFIAGAIMFSGAGVQEQ